MTCQPSEPIKTRTGRPREHDRDQIASELIEWARKDNSINLNAFCCTREPPLDPSKLSNWAKEDDYFRQVFKATKTFLAVRREQWVSSEQLHQSAYSRTSKVYDHSKKKKHATSLLIKKNSKRKLAKKSTLVLMRT